MDLEDPKILVVLLVSIMTAIISFTTPNRIDILYLTIKGFYDVILSTLSKIFGTSHDPLGFFRSVNILKAAIGIGAVGGSVVAALFMLVDIFEKFRDLSR